MQLFRVALLLLAVVLPLSLALLNEAPTSSLTETDQSSLISFVLSQQKSNGTFGDIKNSFFAVTILSRLNNPIPNEQALCEQAKEAIISDPDLRFYSLSISKILRCRNALPASTFFSETDSSGNLSQLYQDVLSAEILNQPFPETILEKALSQVSPSKNSLHNTALALQILAHYAHNPSVSASSRKKVESIVSRANIQKIFDLASRPKKTNAQVIWFEQAGVSPIKTTALLIDAISDLLKEFPQESPLDEQQLYQLGEYFLIQRRVRSLENAFFLFEGLSALSRGPLPILLTISSPHPILSASAKTSDASFKVRVTNLLGEQVTKARVYLLQATPVGDDSNVILSNQELFPVGETETLYTLNFLKKPEPGAYNLEFSVTPIQNSQSRQSFVGFSKGSLRVKVVTSVSISDFEINIQDSPDDVMHRRISVNFNEQAKRLSLGPKQKVVFSFKVRNQVQQRLLRPRQVFLKFTHIRNLHEFYVVAKLDPKLHFSATLNLAALKGISGEYRVELIIGDTFVQNQVVWEFGIFDLTFGENFEPRPVLEKRVLLPEIRHEFRAPEKRPNPFISLVFSGLVLAPILFLLVGWLSVGVNIRNFPFSGPQFFYAVGFHVCLGAILGLFGLYWLELTMFQTLGYLALLAIPTIPLGQQTLRYVYLANQPKAKAE